ncbi:MAG TPA: hypothetical protein VGE98_06280 [Thermoanaerobaculia bacterium]
MVWLPFLPVLLLAGAAPPSTSGAPSRALQADVDRFDRAAAAMDTACSESEADRRAKALGKAIDTLVVHALAAGLPPKKIAPLLGRTPAPREPTPRSATVVSAARFRTELPEDQPAFALRLLPGGDPERLLGVFRLGSGVDDGPTWITLFTHTPDGWRATGRFRSPLTTKVACLDDGKSCARLVALESFVAADRYEGYLHVVRIDGDRLALEPHRFGRLLDFDIVRRGNRLVARYTDTLKHLAGGGIASVRAAWELSLEMTEDGVQVKRRSLNPWVLAVDRAYQANDRARRPPRPDDPPARRLLRDGESSYGDRDGGSLASGCGYVVVKDEGIAWCVRSRRGKDGVWRVSTVEPESACPR